MYLRYYNFSYTSFHINIESGLVDLFSRKICAPGFQHRISCIRTSPITQLQTDRTFSVSACTWNSFLFTRCRFVTQRTAMNLPPDSQLSGEATLVRFDKCWMANPATLILNKKKNGLRRICCKASRHRESKWFQCGSEKITTRFPKFAGSIFYSRTIARLVSAILNHEISTLQWIFHFVNQRWYAWKNANKLEFRTIRSLLMIIFIIDILNMKNKEVIIEGYSRPPIRSWRILSHTLQFFFG